MINNITAGAYNIGLSGLAAAQHQLDVSSHNLSNTDTPNFHRTDVLYTERQHGGVDTSERLNSVLPGLTDQKNYVAATTAADKVKQDALDQGNVTTKEIPGVISAWSDFVNASYNYQQNQNTQTTNQVKETGAQFTKVYNHWMSSIDDIATNAQTQLNYDQSELDNAQKSLAKINNDPMTANDPNLQDQLKSQIATLTGKVAGGISVVNSIVPEIKSYATNGTQGAITQVNTESNSTVFSLNNTNGQIKFEGLPTPKPWSITADTFGSSLGDTARHIGQLDKNSQQNLGIDQNALDGYNAQINSQTGVNQADEIIKIQKAQNMYQSMVKVIDTQNQMFNTLLAIS